jgi:hypothetical protein
VISRFSGTAAGFFVDDCCWPVFGVGRQPSHADGAAVDEESLGHLTLDEVKEAEKLIRRPTRRRSH